MSFENAKANLKELGKELNLDGLEFDENNTCILGIDNAFSLHITYEPNSDRLYLYSPLLDGLPKDEKILLKLSLRLLEGSLLGGQMAGGGVGIALKEELILIHCVLEMGLGVDASALRRFVPIFLDMADMWRKDIVGKIIEGKEPEPFKLPTPQGAPKMPGTGGGMPGDYKKV